MEWPAALGIYGAIVATLTAVWGIWSGFRDRGQLRLELQMKRFDENSYGEEIEKPVDRLEGTQLHLRVVNTGRRPIMVTAWRGVSCCLYSNGVIMPFREVTCRKLLNETEQFSIVSRDFVEAFATDLRRLYVIDSSGRRWYVLRKHLRAIRKKIEVLCSADGEVEEAKP